MKTNKIIWIAWMVVVMVTMPATSSLELSQNSLSNPQYAAGRPDAKFQIFGNDDRTQITDTSVYPYSAIALIRIYWTKEDLVGEACTGWMIGNSALATAAHCIYQGGYPYRVVVKPAMNSDAKNQTPFGICSVDSWVVPDEWVKNHDIQFDYGVYRLGCTAGKQTGTLNFKVTGGDLTGKTLQLSGYPGDKPGRTMWTGFGQVTSASAKGLNYNIDMWPGQSGSPIWDNNDPKCPYCVVAVNSSQFAAPAMNFGARIDQAAFDFLSKEKSYQP
jgi:glutamyl endopeptidase